MELCTRWGRRVRRLVALGLAVGALLGAGTLPADAILTVRTVSKSEDSETTEGTLRYWMKNAAEGDIIAFSGAGKTVNLTSTLTFSKTLSLAGPATITQTGSGCVFRVPSGKSAGMSKLTISGGQGTSYGGGVANAGTLVMNECVVRSNAASGSGGGVWNEGTLTMKGCTIEGNTCKYAGGGVANNHTLTMENCTVTGNTSTFMTHDGGGISSWGTATIKGCTITGNTADNGGGVQNRGTLDMYSSTVTGNTARKSGGGMYVYVGTRLFSVTVLNNTPDQIYGVCSADQYCVIGTGPNSSATAFSGYSGPEQPAPRSITGDVDVAEVKAALANPESALYGAIKQALAADLGKTAAEKTDAHATLSGMGATLYYANTFENVAVESQDLVVEYTASWPENARYYSLFSKADGSGYENPGRGIQFEIKAGQSLPDGAMPPDFYEEGEGLMTWRNVVTDGGSFDLEPAAGIVTFRVCSVRAAEAAENPGGGGCNASAGIGFTPAMLLLLVPILATKSVVTAGMVSSAEQKRVFEYRREIAKEE